MTNRFSGDSWKRGRCSDCGDWGVTTTPEAPTRLGDPEELLLRQVHPKQTAPSGGPSSEAFVPSPRDNDLLSTLRGRVGPAEAHRRWVQDRGYASIGTYAVSIGEVAACELEAVDDEATTEPDHASVDFSSLESKGKKKQTGRKLRDAAVERGCLHEAKAPTEVGDS